MKYRKGKEKLIQKSVRIPQSLLLKINENGKCVNLTISEIVENSIEWWLRN